MLRREVDNEEVVEIEKIKTGTNRRRRIRQRRTGWRLYGKIRVCGVDEDMVSDRTWLKGMVRVTEINCVG